jgi:predicted membrane protein
MLTTLPPEFQRVVHILSVNRAILIAVYSLYYWDLLALFPQEYRYIWKSKTTPTKVCYLLK